MKRASLYSSGDRSRNSQEIEVEVSVCPALSQRIVASAHRFEPGVSFLQQLARPNQGPGCSQIEQSELLRAGLAPVPPFSFLNADERLRLLGQAGGGDCTWFLFVFSGIDCSDCEPMLESVSRFLSDEFGNSSAFRFAEVRVGRALSEPDGAEQRDQVVLITDPNGKFAERAGVVTFPGVVLVSTEGDVVATGLGGFRADAPGFEALSQRIARHPAEMNYPISLVFFGLIVFISFLILGSYLARRR